MNKSGGGLVPQLQLENVTIVTALQLQVVWRHASFFPL